MNQMSLYKIRNLLSQGNSIFSIPLRVASYSRVSTDTDEQLNSLDNQVYYFQNFINENPNWTFVRNYIDEGISGTSTAKRENFLQMIEDAKEGEFDLIITKEISRFSRNLLDSIKYTRELLENNVGVLFQSDNICTFDMDSELRLAIMASIAQEESRKISERLKFGYKRAVEKGRVLGVACYGYNKKDCVMSINEEEAKVVRLIFELYTTEKMGIRRLSDELAARGYFNSNGNPFGHTTLRGILTNPKYKGYYCANKTHSIDYRSQKTVHVDPSEWITYRDENIPAIVSEEIWNKAQKILNERQVKYKQATSNQTKYKYSGKIICAEHDTAFHRTIHRRNSGTNLEYYACAKQRRHGIAGCDAPTLYTRELDEVMRQVNEKVFKHKDDILQSLVVMYEQTKPDDGIEEQIKAVEKRLKPIYKKKEKLLEFSIDGIINKEEFKQRNLQLNKEKESLESELKELQAEIKAAERHAGGYTGLKSKLEKAWGKGFNDSEDDMVAILLDKIIVHKTDNRDVVRLEVVLKTGFSIDADYKKARKGRERDSFISLRDI